MGEKFVHPKIMVDNLEKCYKMSIKDINRLIADLSILVNEEDINKYLKREEKQYLKISKRKIHNDYLYHKVEEFLNSLDTNQFKYDSFQLQYYQKYVQILKDKIKTFLFIIEHLGQKDFESVKEYIKKLDITLDENGDILESDIERLIVPTKYNIIQLTEKIKEANFLSNYINKRITRSQFSSRGISEEEMYPYFGLQLPRYEMYDISDFSYVPFTDKQVREQLNSVTNDVIQLIKKYED